MTRAVIPISAAFRAVAAAIALILASAVPAKAETTLTLTETTTLMIAPDELVASLRADVISSTAADAQNRANAAIQEAVTRARQVAGTEVSTGGYNVWRNPLTAQDRLERWRASQTVNLTSHDASTLLMLVSELQQRGLAVNAVNWRLSRDAQRSAYQQASRQAAAGLRARAEEAAGWFGMRFDQFKEIRLDTQAAIPGPIPRMMTAAVAGAAPPTPPAAIPEDIPVSATIVADALLLPR